MLLGAIVCGDILGGMGRGCLMQLLHCIDLKYYFLVTRVADSTHFGLFMYIIAVGEHGYLPEIAV